MSQWAPRKSSSAWRHLYKLKAYRNGRVAFLEDNPFCVWCFRRGVLTPATRINHIKPHKGDKRLFLAKTNWEGTCESCHNGACKLQDAGKVVSGGDVYGNPMDPNHHWYQQR